MCASGVNGWPLTMPIAASIPEPIGTGEIVALAVHEQLELIENAAIADRQHVDRDAGGIGELHRLGASLAVQRIDLRLFKVRDGRRQILRVLVEPAQEDEDVVRR